MEHVFTSSFSPFSRRFLRHPAAPFLFSFASWNLVTLGDHILNHAHLIGNTGLSTVFNAAAPIIAAFLLAFTLRKLDPLWWATLPQWGGYEDWLLITLDHLTGRLVPPVFYWLDGTNIALTAVKGVLRQPMITMETVHASLVFFMFISIILSAVMRLLRRKVKVRWRLFRRE